jgi:hypothetical protein
VPDPPLAAAASWTLEPAHTVEGVAVGTELNAPPVTVIVTASELEHVVAVEVAVNVNVIVDDRFTVVGSSIVALTS